MIECKYLFHIWSTAHCTAELITLSQSPITPKRDVATWFSLFIQPTSRTSLQKAHLSVMPMDQNVGSLVFVHSCTANFWPLLSPATLLRIRKRIMVSLNACLESIFKGFLELGKSNLTCGSIILEKLFHNILILCYCKTNQEKG